MTKRELLLKLVLPLLGVICLVAVALGVYFGVLNKEEDLIAPPSVNRPQKPSEPSNPEEPPVDLDKITDEYFELVDYYNTNGTYLGKSILLPKKELPNNLELPDTYRGYRIVNINTNAFHGLSFTSVKLSKFLYSINNAAFESCSGITEIVIPADVKQIGENAFANCENLTTLTLEKAGGVKEMVVSLQDGKIHSSSSVYISGTAFSGCGNLNKLVVNSGVMGASVKSNDDFNSLSSSFPMSVSTLSEVVLNEGVTAVGDFTFYEMKSMTKVTINGNGLNYLGVLSFYSTNISEISLPDSVTTFGSNSLWQNNAAFECCYKLNTVKLPNDITHIPGSLFNKCNIENLIIPSGVESIGQNAFDCQNLKTVRFLGAPPTLEKGAINLSNISKIYVPSMYLEEYKSTLSEYVDFIEIMD